jgi:hypothetical protein
LSISTDRQPERERKREREEKSGRGVKKFAAMKVFRHAR